MDDLFPIRESLLVAPCSYAMARRAVESWHYSGKIPAGLLVQYGVWEQGQFIGAIVFGVGTCRGLMDPYGLEPNQGMELVRVALREHVVPVTQILSKAIRLLRREYPKLRLLVSFADPDQGHMGIMYQAASWVYTGMSSAHTDYIYQGERWHGRAMDHKFRAGAVRRDEVQTVRRCAKHRYVFPLDKAMWKLVSGMRKPYPKLTPVTERP